MNTRNTSCEWTGTTAGACVVAGLSMAAGAALGAAAMYLFDPNRGKVRRAKLVDQTTHTLKKATHEAAGKAEDLVNRAKGFAARAGAAVVPAGEADDHVIGSRVRSLMGHITHRAHSVESDVKDGIVTLRGILPEAEHRRLVDEVSHISGVKCVQDCLAHQVAV